MQPRWLYTQLTSVQTPERQFLPSSFLKGLYTSSPDAIAIKYDGIAHGLRDQRVYSSTL